MKVAYPRNDEALAADVKALNEEKIPKFVRCAEKLLVARGGKYFAGNKVQQMALIRFDLLN